MTPAKPDSLSVEWLRNEAEIERLRDLPTGITDPAARERELDRRQDEIEYELGLAKIRNNLEE